MSREVRGAGTKHVAQRMSPEDVARLPQDTGVHRIASSSGPPPQPERILNAMPAIELPARPCSRPIRTRWCATMRFACTATRRWDWMLAGLCGLAVAAGAQTSRLPANPPTSVSIQSSMEPPITAASSGAAAEQRHRARVTYTDGMLQVRADNSSLNQILRDISRQTGMKIIGGVADQRVFGSYGPAPAATVLQTLLDGTNTNMLLQETLNHAPEQLVLSPRTGGPTPPGPSSASYDVTETEPELALPGAPQPSRPAQAGTTPNTTPSTPPSMPQPANNVLGSPNNVSPTASTLPVTNSVPASTLPTPSTAQPVSGIVDAPNPPPAGSTTAGFTSQTPNGNPNTAPPATATSGATGAKTPQQIYEELKQLQQQPKANPQGSSAPQ